MSPYLSCKMGASCRENGIVIERERTAKERGITVDARGYFRGTEAAKPTEAKALTHDQATNADVPMGMPCEVAEPDKSSRASLSFPRLTQAEELDAEPILSRLPKEDADWERKRGLDPVRLHILAEALASSAWKPIAVTH